MVWILGRREARRGRAWTPPAMGSRTRTLLCSGAWTTGLNTGAVGSSPTPCTSWCPSTAAGSGPPRCHRARCAAPPRKWLGIGGTKALCLGFECEAGLGFLMLRNFVAVHRPVKNVQT